MLGFLRPFKSVLMTTLTILIALAAPNPARAARVHLVIVGDTSDPKIGKNVEVDVEGVSYVMQLMGKKSQLPPVKLTGNDCRPERIIQALNNLRLQPDDAVVFYYSGHGVLDRVNGRFMQMPRLGPNAVIPRNQIRDQIAGWVNTRQIRLGVILTDMCSLTKVIPWESTPGLGTRATIEDDPLYTALFVSSRGLVDVNSSEDGQLAVAYPIERGTGRPVYHGTLFGESLCQVLSDNALSRHSWKQILEEENGVRLRVTKEFSRLYSEGVDVPNMDGELQLTQTIKIDSLAELAGPDQNALLESVNQPFKGFNLSNGPGARLLGIHAVPTTIRTRRGSRRGMAVTSVIANTPAAGIIDPGDIILSINGMPTRTDPELRQAVAQAGHDVRIHGRDFRTGDIKDFPLIAMNRGEQPAQPQGGLRLGVTMNPQSFPVDTPAGPRLGVRIETIVPGSPAQGMLDPGDIVLSINGIPTPSYQDFQNAVAAAGQQLDMIGWNSQTRRVEPFATIPLRRVAGQPNQPQPIIRQRPVVGQHMRPE